MLSGSDYDTIVACILTGLALSIYGLISEDRTGLPLGVKTHPLCVVRCYLKSIG